ncbi:MAG: polysaccharide deacetylase family protein [Coriobacteriales bacterium]|nr:polysaccharide deacetylase family protein [Coriobacteriales bacterium]
MRRTLTVLGASCVVLASVLVATLMIAGSDDVRQPRASAVPVAAAKPAATKPAASGTASTSKPKVVPVGSAEPSSAPKPKPRSKIPKAVKNAALDYPDAPSIEPRSYAKLEPKHRYVAITLDDGLPFDERILDLLEDNDIRCTTFLLGSVAADRPDLVRRLHKSGFEIANHTWSHPGLPNLSDGEIREELRRSQKAISKVTKNQAPYLRPPYGATDQRVKQIAAEEGYQIVMWSRTFGDTGRGQTPEKCYRRAMKGVQPGDVILCHWGQDDTYEAMKLVIKQLKRKNLKAVTLSELIADSQ